VTALGSVVGALLMLWDHLRPASYDRKFCDQIGVRW
jgi:hypothetical protein